MTKKIKRTIARYGYPLLQLYWFLFRPHTAGSKVLVISKDSVLLVRHTYNQSSAWTLPGGGIERGESFEDTARRELKEETGIEAHDLKHLGTIRHTLEYKHDRIEVYVTYFDVIPEVARDSVEIAHTQWTPFEEVSKYAGRLTREMLEMYQKREYPTEKIIHR